MTVPYLDPRRQISMFRPLIRRFSTTMSTANTPSTSAVVTFPTFSNPRVAGYTLARPKALNSLNEDMVALLRPKVEGWLRQGDDGPKVILGRGEGRGFCAGGDVKGESWNRCRG